MKNLTCLLLTAFLFTVCSCKKDNSVLRDPDLIGKWKIVANKAGIAGPGVWINVPKDSNQQIEFKADGGLAGNTRFSEDYATYKIKDSITFTLTKKNSDITQNYQYRLKRDTLTIEPAGPIFCIEGCEIKLAKF